MQWWQSGVLYQIYPRSFQDSGRDGKAQLKPVQTVTAGVPFGRPYGSPFAVR